MRYLSVCSGIEAASVAWHHLGWTPVAFSEIEPFPAAVLAHRFPNVPNYGDMTKHEQWPIEPGSIDLLVGGTPCQAFSVAGLRGGLSDPRGGLMLTYLEIARRLRPKWVVWENVPGVLSSGGGRDFGAFLGALGELGYGWAYRVIDAQYCRVDGRWPKAVPQRRRRVFVVGCLLERDPRGRERASEVLALGTGLRWHLEEGAKARKAAPADAEAGARAGLHETVGALCADTHPGAYSGQDAYTGRLIPQPVGFCWQNNDLGLKQDSVTAALRSSAGNSGFHEMNHPVVVNPTLSLFDQGDTRATTAVVNMQGSKSNACVSTDGSSFTLNAMHGHDVHAVAFTPGNLARGAGPSPNTEVAPTQRCSAGRGADDQRTCVAFSSNMSEPDFQTDGTTPTVKVGSGLGIPSPPAVAFTRCDNGRDASVEVTPTMRCGSNYSAHPAVAHALRGEGFDASEDGTGRGTPLVPQAMTVRRLTPTECSRLQGFPDDWTLIPWRGKPAEQCPDGPRYKALGNSMAVNCMAWIGERIAAVEDTHA